MQAGNWYALDYDCLHGLAHYEIARLDPSYKPKAIAFLEDDLVYFEAQSQVKPFHSPLRNPSGGVLHTRYWEQPSRLSGTKTFPVTGVSRLLPCHKGIISWVVIRGMYASSAVSVPSGPNIPTTRWLI